VSIIRREKSSRLFSESRGKHLQLPGIAGGFAAHFFLTGLRDDADLIVQQSANRPSDVLGFAAALAKIAL